MSEHESLRKALSWLLEHEQLNPQLIAEASRQFDLSPVDEEFLRRYFIDEHRQKSDMKSKNTRNDDLDSS
ncbi:hypothetical protein [Oceanisphaera psychrotolerans]|uniref:Uncharacterized protein n=1 Tax=Oceanisphaera psychrotolerans TaxID=1414654 RepID=A0A1J4QIH9_9GAMM|nr:hypothetical protein [Oceanisphaera psychrotolerans]OIN13110.1 hypothetical protein BFR47_10575 [Oceanisphaera psychrotolerans]